MEPTLFNGDIVIVSRETVVGVGDGFMSRGLMGLTVKRTAFVGSKVHLISDNLPHPAVAIDPEVRESALVAKVRIQCQ